MPDYIAQDTDFTLVANAIRTKTGDSGLLEWPSGFKTAIDNIVDTDCIKTVGPAPVVSVPDAAPLDAEGLVVDIEPVQAGSGDPSPENVRPISGWTGAKVTRAGKNLFDKENANVVNAYLYGDLIKPGSQHRIVYIDCKPSTTYIISNSANGRVSCACTKDVPQINTTGTDYSLTGTITTTADSKYLCIYCYNGSSDTVTFQEVIDALKIELGSTATDYEPYQGDTYDITFPAEAGTVYGGTLDVVNGVLTVDRAYAELTKDSNWEWNSGNSLAICSIPGAVIANENNQRKIFVQNNLFTNSAWVGRNTPEYSCGLFFGASYVFVRSTNHIASVDDLKALIGDRTLQVVYELATPVTYTLTPQQIAMLRGNNTLWVDTGDVTLKYFTTAFEDLAEEIGFADGGDY